MSFFDDDNDDSHYYDAGGSFQEKVLRNAEKLEKHPLAYLATQEAKALDAMEEFVGQDPHISKGERVAIKSDIEEARDALERVCKVIPADAVEEQ